MATQAYRDWLAAGSPYERSRPTLEFRDLIRRYGYTVYDYPDTGHLTADLPEDHTPFSATGWPIPSARWVGHADDIMPPTAFAIADKGAIPLPVLARRIIAAKDAKIHGTQWIKYMNWTDENGDCWREDWRSGKRVTSRSTDKGHIHISGRSDMDTSDVVSASGWNPLEDDMTSEEHSWLLNVYTGMFKGGTSCGEVVTVPGMGTGNSLFLKLDYIVGLLRSLQTTTSAQAAALLIKVNETLAAALDDGDATVVLPPEGIAALEEIKAMLAAVPTAEQNADAVVAEIAS